MNSKTESKSTYYNWYTLYRGETEFEFAQQVLSPVIIFLINFFYRGIEKKADTKAWFLLPDTSEGLR